MNVSTRWKRSSTVLAGAAAVATIVAGTAQAVASPTPARTATTYTDSTYLQDALGLPSTDTSPAIQTVTYDNFQYLLKQTGNFAFLVGDPADANFKARAQDVETAAEADHVKTVYWFDPNLSGDAKVGNTTEPNLDIRNAAGITSLTSASQTIYGYSWTNLVAQYLGNGYKATIVADPTAQLAKGAEGGTITTALDPTVVNDAGSTDGQSTEVGNTDGGALYDYTGGTDATATDDYFFVYNKDRTDGSTPAKIASWVDLSKEAGSPSTQADVTTAVTSVGAANLTTIGQGAFWESEVNAKYSGDQPEPAANPGAYDDAPGSDKVLSDADASDWRIQQITYPQLVHLLSTDTTQNAVILFGGTWCPNTRAVLESVNQQAIANNIPVVYNFDTVLDGGWIGGSTTSQANPFQSRNYAGVGGSSDPTQSNPSYLYGDLITSYLANIATEYDPTIGSGFVSYYPGGNNAKALKDVRKLQVPFLIGYQRNSSTNPYNSGNGGITRQWIQQHTDVNGLPYFTEYMSEPYDTHPQPNSLGLNIPNDAAIWSTINSDLGSFSWTSSPTDPALTSHYNTATDADDASYLGSADLATVTFKSGTVTAAPATNGVVSINPAALSAAQAALGSNAPTTKAAAQAALLAANGGSDSTLTANLSTVFAAYSVAQSRKTSILNAWSSVQFGLEAIAKLQTFFGGLPGGVVSTQTVTAEPVGYGTAPTINLAIANDYGRIPTGTVSLVVTSGSTTVDSDSAVVAQNAASFALPKLAPGSYSYTLSYPGDDQIAAFTRTGTVSVTKAKVSKLAGTVTKAPTTQAAGSYKTAITVPSGLAAATGTVTAKLTSGKTSHSITGKLSSGAVTLSVPKLAAGTWTVALSWPGDADYLAATATGASITVAKAKVSKLAGAVSSTPTSKAAGKYKVTITTASGDTKATGTVTVKVKRGSATHTITGKLAGGVVTVSVPKLAKGTWTVALSWPGDVNYAAATATGASIKVTK